MDERANLNELSDQSLVAYWNVLQASKRCLTVDPDGKVERHTQIVDDLLTKRQIPHEIGKRIVEQREINRKS